MGKGLASSALERERETGCEGQIERREREI